MILDLDEHLDLVEREAKAVLGAAEASDLLVMLRRRPLLAFQKQLLLRINGQLNRLAMTDLSKDGALIEAARVQGTIQGLRSFFEIAAELLSEAEPEGGIL